LDVAYGYDEAERLSVIAPNPSGSLQLPTPLTLSYNQWNGLLASVSTNGVFAESYTWDPLGNRLSTTDASGVTYHAYDGSQCIADYNSSGDLIASYTWGSGIDLCNSSQAV